MVGVLPLLCNLCLAFWISRQFPLFSNPTLCILHLGSFLCFPECSRQVSLSSFRLRALCVFLKETASSQLACFPSHLFRLGPVAGGGSVCLGRNLSHFWLVPSYSLQPWALREDLWKRTGWEKQTCSGIGTPGVHICHCSSQVPIRSSFKVWLGPPYSHPCRIYPLPVAQPVRRAAVSIFSPPNGWSLTGVKI